MSVSTRNNRVGDDNDRLGPDSLKLPKPQERPGATIVVFDGQCVFCRRQVEKLDRWDRNRRLSFISLHDPFMAEQYPDLSRDDLMKQMYVIDAKGKRYGGADGVRVLAGILPRLWPLLPLMHLPLAMPLWRWAYDQIARRRYRLARPADQCENGTCTLHQRR